jgi:truncated hemoglobin YjbI
VQLAIAPRDRRAGGRPYNRRMSVHRDDVPSLFEWAGGSQALLRLTRCFYAEHVPRDALLGPLFAGMQPDHPERVAAWLGEVFGGPAVYSERYGGYVRMLRQHLDRALTEEQRARWVLLLCRAADEVGLPADPEFRAAFVSYLEWGSRIAKENSAPGAEPPAQMPVPKWWWVCDAYPDARPSSRQATSEAADEAPLPAAGEPLTFAKIAPLFRERDRTSMRFAFDLGSFDDVKRHAGAILERLRAGTMPCDGPWPAEKVEVFARWIAEGAPR